MRGIIGWVKCDICGRVAETFTCSTKRGVLRVCALCGVAVSSLKEEFKCSIPFKVKKREKPKLEPDAEILRRLSSIGVEKAKKKA